MYVNNSFSRIFQADGPGFNIQLHSNDHASGFGTSSPTELFQSWRKKFVCWSPTSMTHFDWLCNYPMMVPMQEDNDHHEGCEAS
jgi:hypothetical protein